MPFKFSLYGTPVAVSGRTFERGAAEQRVAPDVRRCDPERPLVNANVMPLDQAWDSRANKATLESWDSRP